MRCPIDSIARQLARFPSVCILSFAVHLSGCSSDGAGQPVDDVVITREGDDVVLDWGDGHRRGTRFAIEATQSRSPR